MRFPTILRFVLGFVVVTGGGLIARTAGDEPPPLEPPADRSDPGPVPAPRDGASVAPLQDEGRLSTSEPVTDTMIHEALQPSSPAPPVVRAEKAPPPPIVERPGSGRPSPDARWVGGYWAWDTSRGDFSWITGVWRIPPTGQTWLDGAWRRDARGWYRTPGQWAGRSSPASTPPVVLRSSARPAAPTRSDLPPALDDSPRGPGTPGRPPAAISAPDPGPAAGRPSPADPRPLATPPGLPAPPMIGPPPGYRPVAPPLGPYSPAPGVVVYPGPPPPYLYPYPRAVPRFYGFPGARLTNRILDRVLP